ncbi:hypothetical protein POM88_036973 [Heracleum sosnowskyi]|uniref:DNA helicase n=1 Tax=Heracleum sosnowskyi TaxID=360622 RepID=A0AAD8HPH7_9APIA|nr:hypothetical protein POM88_036973 [Heracleum sosnowskyi]
MNTDDDGSKAWHLFDSEEMIHGYKREKHPRKRQMIRNQGRSLNNSPTSCSVEGPLPTSNATSNDELSSSSHRGLKKKKENSSSVIGLPACVGRTPLGDITNKKVRRGLRCKMKLKSLPEEELKSFSRNLFEENFQRDADHDDHDDEIEESLIDGAVVSDDGLFDSDDSYEEYCSTQSFGAHNHSESDSDIEDDMKFAGHRFIPLRREQVIPEEYASLGSPSVQCNSPSEINQLNAFAQWVLDIGNGKVLPPEDDGYKYVEDDIVIPAEFCDISNVNSVDNMINSTFPDFLENCQNPKYLSERAILTPTNQTVGHLNSLIVEKIPGESISYLSVDSAEEFGALTEIWYNKF